MAPITEHGRAYGAIVTAMVSISFAAILIKWSDSPAFVLATYRLAFTCILILPFVLWTKGLAELRGIGRRELSLLLVAGAALALHFGLWIVSLDYTLVSTSVILVTSHPLFVAAVSHFVLKERVRRIAVLGILIAFAGVGIIALADYSRGFGTLFGDLLAFLGGMCAGVYFLAGRVARQRISTAPYVLSVYSIAGLGLLLAAVVAGDDLAVSEGRELTLFLLLAIVPTMLGHTMFNYALGRVPAYIVSTSLLGEPLGASVLAFFLIADEVPSIWIVLGGALVLGGLYIVLSKGYGEERLR